MQARVDEERNQLLLHSMIKYYIFHLRNRSKYLRIDLNFQIYLTLVMLLTLLRCQISKKQLFNSSPKNKNESLQSVGFRKEFKELLRIAKRLGIIEKLSIRLKKLKWSWLKRFSLSLYQSIDQKKTDNSIEKNYSSI